MEFSEIQLSNIFIKIDTRSLLIEIFIFDSLELIIKIKNNSLELKKSYIILNNFINLIKCF